MTKEVEEKKEVKRVVKTAPKKVTVNAKKKVTTAKKKVINDDVGVQKLDEKKVTKNAPKTKTEKISEVDSKTEEKELTSYLPDNFYPRYSKHGMIGTGGCVIIPNRIFIFIENNQEDWYMKMEELPFKTEIGFLHALLYYIIEDGYVNIHEIGSDSYYKLTISEEDGLGKSEGIADDKENITMSLNALTFEDDVTNGDFDDSKSTLTITPSTLKGDGKSSSTFSATLYSKSDPDRKLEGVTSLNFTMSNGTLGNIGDITEVDGTYTGTFTSNNKVHGVTDISFVTGTNGINKSSKKEIMTVEKTAEVLYEEDVANGAYDDEKSTISVSPSSIVGDGKTTSKVSVTLYSKSDPTQLLKGVTGVKILSSVAGIGTLGTVTEVDGVYSATFTSVNKKSGATDLSFETTAGKSTKKAKITVTKSKEVLYEEDVANGTFDDSKTILELRPASGLVTGSNTDLIVTLYSKSDPTRKLVGVSGLTISGLTIGTTNGAVVDGDSYKFSITSLKAGSNDLSVKTANTTGTKVIKLTVTKNAEELLADDIAGGLFDDTKSTIVSDKSSIEFTKRETGAEVTVTLYAKSDPTQLLAGVTSVELESSGTAQGDITKGVAENGTYKFNIGVPTVEGEQVLKFKTAGGTSTKSVKITYTEKVPPKPEPSDDLFYLTFPERDGALFYAPFQVLYEINRIQEENDGEWNNLAFYEESVYADYIATIAHLIETYPNTLVLESRNGYHLTNEQLLAGEFYKVR